jgi:hypothetical protein
VGAEPAVAHADAVLGRQVLGHMLRGPAVDGERDHADPVRAARPQPQGVHPVDRRESAEQAVHEEPFLNAERY